jgi:hypothetical protein
LRANDLLTNGHPVALPLTADVVFAVLVVDKTGAAATVYASLSPAFAPPLRFLDFELGGITSGMWCSMVAKLEDMARSCRARVALLYVPDVLVPSARAAGVDARAID